MDTKYKNVVYRKHVKHCSEKMLENNLEILKIHEETWQKDMEKWEEFKANLKAHDSWSFQDTKARSSLWAQATGWWRSAAQEFYYHLRSEFFLRLEEEKKIRRLLIENNELKKEVELLKSQPYN